MHARWTPRPVGAERARGQEREQHAADEEGGEQGEELGREGRPASGRRARRRGRLEHGDPGEDEPQDRERQAEGRERTASHAPRMTEAKGGFHGDGAAPARAARAHPRVALEWGWRRACWPVAPTRTLVSVRRFVGRVEPR